MTVYKISHTKLELYEQCGLKYRFRYIDNLKADVTSTPLLFGSALDYALNYVLESIRDKKDWSTDVAKEKFIEKMSEWSGQNKLEFFKNEAPEELADSLKPNNPEHQELVWDNITKRGLACIDVYVKEVLPQFAEIVSVQTNVEIKNDQGDTLVGVVDFIAKMHDGRVVLFDNKSASAKYPKNRVIQSQQLSLYLESYPEIKYAGYVVMIKNPEKEKGLTYQILIDEIPEETKQKSFDKVVSTLDNIKAEKFEKNEKSCWAFGRKCDYWALCKNNDSSGLVPAYEKKETNENQSK